MAVMTLGCHPRETASPDGAAPAGPKKIMVFVGDMSVQNAQDRYAGIEETLKGADAEILAVRTDSTDHVRAKSNVADTLVRYPDIACLVGLWSYNGPAIVSAVSDASMIGKVKIVCFDEENETLQGVKDGAIYATVVQQPYEFGYQAIKLMYAYSRGDHSVFPENKIIIVPTRRIDQSNVDEFWENLKRLRGGSAQPDATPATAGATAAQTVRLAFVTNNSSDFWTIARAGCDKAVEELNARDGAGAVSLQFKLPGEGTAAQQRQIIDDLLAMGIDGIAISPNDPENQTQYLNEVASKCLLITQDSDAANSNRACYIGTNNKQAGIQAGQIIKEALFGGQP
jgi:ribose transport system substrate-binding protein